MSQMSQLIPAWVERLQPGDFVVFAMQYPDGWKKPTHFSVQKVREVTDRKIELDMLIDGSVRPAFWKQGLKPLRRYRQTVTLSIQEATPERIKNVELEQMRQDMVWRLKNRVNWDELSYDAVKQIYDVARDRSSALSRIDNLFPVSSVPSDKMPEGKNRHD